jgi:hypothetical protein
MKITLTALAAKEAVEEARIRAYNALKPTQTLGDVRKWSAENFGETSNATGAMDRKIAAAPEGKNTLCSMSDWAKECLLNIVHRRPK